MEAKNNRVKVLVVDDEGEMRNLMSRILSRQGYYCATASNGLIALDMLNHDQFDLILLDLFMPMKSGKEVLAEIKTRDLDCAVIVVTGVADVQTAVDAMNLGASDYLLKPIEQGLLKSVIARSLEKRRLVKENKEYQIALETKVKEQTEKIRTGFFNSIKALAIALEAKDRYTSGHSQRVTTIATAIARKFNLDESMVEKIRIAGLLHDIGKIGISDILLSKPGRLSQEEFAQIRNHCLVGPHILEPIIEDPDILYMIKHHHERFDGGGYPDGPKWWNAENRDVGSNESDEHDQWWFGSMILTLADSWDAMTSDRAYRPAMSTDNAKAEIYKNKGTQFHPGIVEVFLSMFECSEPVPNYHPGQKTADLVCTG